MSVLTGSFSVVDVYFAIEGVEALVTVNGSGVLGSSSSDSTGCGNKYLYQQVFQVLLSRIRCLMVLWIQNQAGNVIDLYLYALNHSIFLLICHFADTVCCYSFYQFISSLVICYPYLVSWI